MKKSIRVVSCVLLLAFCFLLSCSCSMAMDVPRYYGEEVVVTASRIPQLKSSIPWSLSVITSSEIQAYGSKTVADALRNVPGVDIKTNGSLGSASSAMLRGSSSQQVLILLNGNKMNSPLLGTFDLGDILVDNIERIEIVKSPLSALYGADAVGGAINIITKSPADGKQLSADISYGTFGTQLIKLNYGGGELVQYLLSASVNKSDGFRQNSDYNSQNYNLAISSGDLKINSGYYKAIKGVPGVPSTEADPYSASTPDERQKDENASMDLQYKNFKIFQKQGDQFYHYQFGLDDRYRYWSRGLTYKQDLEYSKNIFSYGLDFTQNQVDSSLAGSQTTDNSALFLQNILYSDKLSLTMGIRGDNHSVYGGVANPRIGVVAKLPSNMILRTSYGTAFKAPTFNDLFSSWGGNRNIKPERSQNFDIGLEKQITESLVAKASIYYNTIENLIQWLPPTWSAANIGSVKLRGVEIELTKQTENCNWFLNYSYDKSEDETPAYKDKVLIYRPTNKLNAGLSIAVSACRLSGNLRYVGERYVDQSNTILLSPSTLIGLKAEKNYGVYTPYFSIDNLLNMNYFESYDNMTGRYYPMPGRTYTIGVKWNA